MLLNNVLTKRSNFTKNVLLIASGTAFAQIISILVSPIVTRLYTPEDFGILSVYSSILGLLAVVASLKYELAIPIAEDDETAVNVVVLCVFLLFSFVLILFVIIFFFGEQLIGIANIQNTEKIKYYISPGVFFIGMYTIFRQWSYRRKNYKALSKTKYMQTISQNGIKIILGLFRAGFTGILLGSIVGESAGITTLALPFLKEDRKLLKSIGLSKIKHCIHRYRVFPIFSTISQFADTAGLYLPSLLMASLFQSSVVGLYGLANSVISLPMNLIGNSVSEVFFAEAARFGKKEPWKLRRLMDDLLKKLILIGILPITILFICGPFLFSIIFGQEWREAGQFARLMVPLLYFRFIFTPVSRVYVILEKQKESLVLNCFRVVLVLFVFFVSKTMLLRSYDFILLYSIAMSIVYFVTYFMARKIVISIENTSPDGAK
jgi:O-antigen/teichoic acid export membrane protein